MDLKSFEESLGNQSPPENLSEALLALWHDAKGDWEASHDIAQEIHSKTGSLIHAYLHRKEGDAGNAEYWYSKAGKPYPKCSLEEEWSQIVSSLL